MKKFGKLRRGFLLLLCVLCLASACAVPAYAAGTAKCTTPVLACKYLGKFQVAVIVYYDPGDTLSVKVNGTETPVMQGSSPAVLSYYLPEKAGILVTAVARDPSTPTPKADSDPASIVINGYTVPSSTLRVDPSSPGVNKFSDVPLGSWYRQDVNRLVKAGAINGVTPTVFAPDEPMTVAQYLKVLLASMYQDEMINAFYKGSRWYDPYFEFSALLPINEDGFVSVEDAEREISRYEMAVLLARAYKMLVQPNVYQHALASADSGAIGDFDSIPEQYREAVLVCYFTKMLKGTDGIGSFCGDSSLTRCQASATVVRLFDAI